MTVVLWGWDQKENTTFHKAVELDHSGSLKLMLIRPLFVHACGKYRAILWRIFFKLLDIGGGLYFHIDAGCLDRNLSFHACVAELLEPFAGHQNNMLTADFKERVWPFLLILIGLIYKGRSANWCFLSIRQVWTVSGSEGILKKTTWTWQMSPCACSCLLEVGRHGAITW